jgi:hypothetical protein
MFVGNLACLATVVKEITRSPSDGIDGQRGIEAAPSLLRVLNLAGNQLKGELPSYHHHHHLVSKTHYRASAPALARETSATSLSVWQQHLPKLHTLNLSHNHFTGQAAEVVEAILCVYCIRRVNLQGNLLFGTGMDMASNVRRGEAEQQGRSETQRPEVLF